MQKYNYVLTSSGFKTTSDLTSKDLTYNRFSKMSRVTFTQNINKNSKILFSTISLCNSDIPLILPKDKEVLSVDLDTFEKKFIKVVNLTEDHWVFSPWVEIEYPDPSINLDLSLFVDNYRDSFNIFLFNNEILEIADKLKLPLKALKELLVREAAEYDEHLSTLKTYIYDRYGISEEDNKESSFLNFKKYVLKNHVYKMSRFITVEEDFIDFIVSSLLRGKINQTSHYKNNKYQITYFFKDSDVFLKEGLKRFLNKLKLKYEENGNNIIIKNKPLFMLISKGVFNDSKFLNKLSPSLKTYFINSLQKYSKNIFNVSLETALIIKTIFQTYKIVVSITENPLGSFNVNILKDDFESLDSSLIVTRDGYFTKIREISNTINPKETFVYINTEDNEVLYKDCCVKV